MAQTVVTLALPRLRWMLMVLTALGLGLAPVAALAAPPAVGHAQADEAQWLVMLYSDADDNVLEQDIMLDLQEAELVGSTDQVTIVAQIDRFEGGFAGVEEWTGTRRLLITQDDDLNSLGSEVLEDLGEVNMADGATLQDFIEWAVTNFPAQKRMLIMSDHGAGWPGGLSDPDPGGNGPDDLVLAEGFGDNLWLMELDLVLGQALDNLGLESLDVIGFDACLMSQLEVYTALAPHAQYAVASEEIEPGLGWAYAGFLSKLVADPAMGGDELVTQIVASYIDDDIQLENPDYVGNLTRQQAAVQVSPNVTLSAIDLAQIAPLNAALDDFVTALQGMDQNAVAEARTYAQAYEAIFGDEWPSPYIDLGHFAQLIQNSTADPAVLDAAQALDAARIAAVIAEKHGPSRPGSTGVAIYFPVRSMYEIAGNFGYTTVAARFAEETQWDEFLAFHSGDAANGAFARPASARAAALQALMPEQAPEFIRVLDDDIAAMLEQGAAADEIAQALVDTYDVPVDVATALLDQGLLGADTTPSAPVNNSVRKPLQIAPVTLSAEVAYVDEPVTVETEITGDRVGYVYSFIGRLLPEDEIMIIEDQDFLFAEQDTAVGGVSYPQWPEGAFTVAYEWEPVVYAISDGTTAIRTLFSPETYGEEPTYVVAGTYLFADGSADRYARLFFRDGELAQVFGFLGSGALGTGAPREIRPQPGDQFTVMEQGFHLAADAPDESYSAAIGTLTFGDTRFTIEATAAPSGNYVVGVIAEDLDGNQVESYESLFVVSDDGVTEEGFVPLVNEDLGFALLHPATWTPLDDAASDNRVVLTTADDSAQMTVSLFQYPDAADADTANLAALEDIYAEYANDASVEQLEAVGDPVAHYLGYFNAQLLDFAFERDGVAYAGEIIAATPAEGLTYIVDFVAPAAAAEELLTDLDAVLYSFDVLIPGIDSAPEAIYQPAFDEMIFEDDYSDPASGLYDDAVAQAWGQGYYDAESELYVYAMSPASGAIYDYYVDLALPDSFMLQVAALSAGAVNTAYGLIFQVQDDSHFYVFRVSGDGYFLVEKADGENLETLVDWTPLDTFDSTEEAVNTLAVVGGAGFYDLYVNEVLAGSFADDSYTAGSAGYLVENFDATAPAAFVFDDFVAGLPAE